MQSLSSVAVWLGVGVLAACGAPGDDLEQPEGVASGRVADVAEPPACRAATLGDKSAVSRLSRSVVARLVIVATVPNQVDIHSRIWL